MKTFEELSLIEPVMRAVRDAGYSEPTEIQAAAIPPILAERDVLGCAQTGTGKTAAFALPILSALGGRNRKSIPNRPFVLVLAPTRELAGQIEQSFREYGKHLKLRTCTIYGGVGQARQVKALKAGTHILIATPGRLLDLIGQGHLDLSKLEFFVLDEADRMLDMGFLPAIRRVINMLPKQRQSLFFSATVGKRVTDLSRELLTDPARVNVTPRERSVAAISQRVIHTQPREKRSLLKQLLADPGVERAVVFTRTKRGANDVAKFLRDGGLSASAIHGNKSQHARERTLAGFKRGTTRVLVATDVASRGIDVDDVTHVINFDLPHEPEAYVHRVGRTGRAGREGTAIAFCTPAERGDLRAIERLIGSKLEAEGDVPQDAPRERSHRKPAHRKPSGKRPASQKRHTQPKRKTAAGKNSAGKSKSKSADERPMHARSPAARKRRRRRQQQQSSAAGK